MEVPKVINELIRSYMWAIEHPVCKLLRDKRTEIRNDRRWAPYQFHADSFFPYETHNDEYGISRHMLTFRQNKFPRFYSESFYCHRCGESYTELVGSVIERCTCYKDYSEI